jgi:ABC-type branched-subunit amino acid transport system substrate-binding protein
VNVKARLALWVVVVAMLGAACGGRGDDTDRTAPRAAPTTGGPTRDCEGARLEATEVGVTPDTITIQVMADVGSPLAPGLFQGNLDALNAFAERVNAAGGVACRRLVVRTWDSKLSPEESKNGLIEACKNALALVGSNALFNPDVSPMVGCTDKAGKPTGLPDIAALANDLNQQCSPVTFLIQAVPEQCPIVQGQPRPLKAFVGPIRYYLSLEPNLHGVYQVPGDLPTTVQSATYQIKAMEDQGVKWDALLKVSGRDTQAAYTPRIQVIKQTRANFVYNGSNDRAMINVRKEAKAQGVDSVKIWACSLACYTRNMLTQGGADVEGTYLWMQFIPFEEADTNAEAKAYVESVGRDKVDSFGAQAWQAAVLFKKVIDEIVDQHGLNGITRARMLEVLRATKNFDANGWMGPKDLRGISDCFVLLQIRDGSFVRVHPRQRGTLDCNPANVVTIMLDPVAEAAKIK